MFLLHRRNKESKRRQLEKDFEINEMRYNDPNDILYDDSQSGGSYDTESVGSEESWDSQRSGSSYGSSYSGSSSGGSQSSTSSSEINFNVVGVPIIPGQNTPQQGFPGQNGTNNSYMDYVVRDGIVHEEEFVGGATKKPHNSGGNRRERETRKPSANGRSRGERATRDQSRDQGGRGRDRRRERSVRDQPSNDQPFVAEDIDGLDVEPGFVHEERYLPKADKQQKKPTDDSSSNRDRSSNRGQSA